MKSSQVSLALITLTLATAYAAPALGQSTNSTDASLYWFQQGLSLYNMDKYEESLNAYDKALELNPNDFEAWNNKGIDLGLLGRYDEALTAFNNAVALNDSYAEAWYNMGVIYDFKGSVYTAAQAYKKATQINPSYQKAWVMRNVATDTVMSRSLSCSCQDQIALV